MRAWSINSIHDSSQLYDEAASHIAVDPLKKKSCCWLRHSKFGSVGYNPIANKRFFKPVCSVYGLRSTGREATDSGWVPT